MENNPPAEAKKEALTDRLYGSVFGAAIASAVALPCDGRDAAVLRDNYDHDREAKKATFLDFPRKTGTRSYAPNDWSGDVDQAVLVMRAYTDAAAMDGGVAPNFERALAARVKEWTSRGFPELSDPKGEADSMTAAAVLHPNYLERPREAASEIANSDALGAAPMVRAAPLAILLANEGAALSAVAAGVTHSDRRVWASAAFLSTLLGEIISADAPTPGSVRLPASLGRKLLPGKEQKTAFRRNLDGTETLEKCGLEYPDGSGQVSKAIKAAVWSLRQVLRKGGGSPAFFEDLVLAVALCGRHASRYAAICGSIAGAAVGFRGLPRQWVDGLANAAWLKKEIGVFVRSVAEASAPPEEPALPPEEPALPPAALVPN